MEIFPWLSLQHPNLSLPIYLSTGLMIDSSYSLIKPEDEVGIHDVMTMNPRYRFTYTNSRFSVSGKTLIEVLFDRFLAVLRDFLVISMLRVTRLVVDRDKPRNFFSLFLSTWTWDTFLTLTQGIPRIST